MMQRTQAERFEVLHRALSDGPAPDFELMSYMLVNYGDMYRAINGKDPLGAIESDIESFARSGYARKRTEKCKNIIIDIYEAI